MSLPNARDGDRLDGSACVVPASLSYCAGCGCLRAWNNGWFTRKDDAGMTEFYCARHRSEETPDAAV